MQPEILSTSTRRVRVWGFALMLALGLWDNSGIGVFAGETPPGNEQEPSELKGDKTPKEILKENFGRLRDEIVRQATGIPAEAEEKTEAEGDKKSTERR